MFATKIKLYKFTSTFFVKSSKTMKNNISFHATFLFNFLKKKRKSQIVYDNAHLKQFVSIIIFIDLYSSLFRRFFALRWEKHVTPLDVCKIIFRHGIQVPISYLKQKAKNIFHVAKTGRKMCFLIVNGNVQRAYVIVKRLRMHNSLNQQFKNNYDFDHQKMHTIWTEQNTFI